MYSNNQNKELKDAIDTVQELVNQDCTNPVDGKVESLAISAYCDAIKFLVKYNRLKIVKEHGRVIVAEWVK